MVLESGQSEHDVAFSLKVSGAQLVQGNIPVSALIPGAGHTSANENQNLRTISYNQAF